MERASGERVFLLGDFNSPAGGEVHQIFTATFHDSWTGGPEGTFHGFTGIPTRHRLDWILCRGPIHVESCVAITAPVAGRYPSDHFPVLGSFRI
jgi:endonuclease/exonuclease/phosphatase family metal-dependent hydrolase